MALREWSFHVHDRGLGQYGEGLNSTGYVNIVTSGVATSPTNVYLNERGSEQLTSTAVAQGVLANTIATMVIAGGYVRFWTDTSVTALDISYVTDTGEAGYILGASSSNHMLTVDSTAQEYTYWQPIAWKAAATVTDTTVNIPGKLWIKDASLFVDVVDAGETVDIGILASETGGDEDGFLDGMNVANLGMVSGHGIITEGSTINHYLHTNGKYGALLYTMNLGADTGILTIGGQTKLHYVTDGTATSLTYTPSTSDTFTAFAVLTWAKTFG